MANYPLLFSPLRIGPRTLKNRIVSSGHDTVMVRDGRVTDQLVAYHEARAEGGVGLIVVQVAGVHETARYTSHVLMATDDSCIDGYARLADGVHGHGAVIFGQETVIEQQLATVAQKKAQFGLGPLSDAQQTASQLAQSEAQVTARLER